MDYGSPDTLMVSLLVTVATLTPPTLLTRIKSLVRYKSREGVSHEFLLLQVERPQSNMWIRLDRRAPKDAAWTDVGSSPFASADTDIAYQEPYSETHLQLVTHDHSPAPSIILIGSSSMASPPSDRRRSAGHLGPLSSKSTAQRCNRPINSLLPTSLASRLNNLIYKPDHPDRPAKVIVFVDFDIVSSSIACSISSGSAKRIIWLEACRKSPSCFVYDAKGKVCTWDQHALTKRLKKGWVRCEMFKLFFDPTMPSRGVPEGIELVDVVSDYLDQLWKHAVPRILDAGYTHRMLQSADIWISIPAVWNQQGTELMREAVFRSGMTAHLKQVDGAHNRLHIIKAPGVAAVHSSAAQSSGEQPLVQPSVNTSKSYAIDSWPPAKPEGEEMNQEFSEISQSGARYVIDRDTILKKGPPMFERCTKVSVSPSDSIYVAKFYSSESHELQSSTDGLRHLRDWNIDLGTVASIKHRLNTLHSGMCRIDFELGIEVERDEVRALWRYEGVVRDQIVLAGRKSL